MNESKVHLLHTAYSNQNNTSTKFDLSSKSNTYVRITIPYI